MIEGLTENATISFYRAMHYSAKRRGIAIAFRLLSARL